MPYFLLNNTASYSKKSSVDKLYDVSVKSINCVCARTNKQFILIDTPNTENEIKWCEHAILWEFEVFEDCGNCIAMEQSGYISEWQNLLLTLTSLYLFCHHFLKFKSEQDTCKADRQKVSNRFCHINSRSLICCINVGHDINQWKQ